MVECIQILADLPADLNFPGYSFVLVQDLDLHIVVAYCPVAYFPVACFLVVAYCLVVYCHMKVVRNLAVRNLA